VPHNRPGAVAGSRGHDRVEPELLRECDPFVHRVDRAARHPDPVEAVEPLARGPRGQLLGQQRPQELAVGGAPRVVLEPRVVGQFGRPDRLAQLAELPVVPGRDDQVAVGGGKRLVGEQARVGVAHPERDRPGRRVGAGLVDHAGHGRSQQRGVQVLALTGRVAVVERGQHRDRGVEAGHHVEDRDARPERRAAGVAGERHHARHGLHDQVVAGQVPASGGAEAADRRVDDGRVERADRLVVKAVLGQPARLEVLHQHVGPAGQLTGQAAIALVGQVERDRPLVPVDRQVVGGHAVLGKRRHPRPGVIATGRLDLDHLGAHVGQQHRAVRPGEHPGEVRDKQPG
jgi:hypothetical protein